MKSLFLRSTKYDGSLHYSYPTQVVHETSTVLTVYVGPGTPIKSYRGAMYATHHSLQYYWADRRYNLHISWYGDWRPRLHYINIATPATWNEGTIHFVDMDLDVIWRAQTGEVLLDDEDEFALHQVRFGYPPALITACQRSSAVVMELIAQRVYPFDESLYAWRPNGTP